MLVALQVPADNPRGPLYMEQALAGMHRGNVRRLPITCGMMVNGGSLHLTCRFPDVLRGLVESHLYAQFPDAGIVPLPEEPLPAGMHVWTADLMLDPYLFPIKRYSQFEEGGPGGFADPLSGILAVVSRAQEDGFAARVDLEVTPASPHLEHRARRCLEMLATPFLRTRPHISSTLVRLALAPRVAKRSLARLAAFILPLGEPDLRHLSASPGRAHDREDDLLAASDKLGRVLFACRLRLVVTGPAEACRQALGILTEMAGAFAPFAAPRLSAFRILRQTNGRSIPRRRHADAFLLSAEELATLFHPATQSVRSPALSVVESREMPAPATLPTPEFHHELATLGCTVFRGMRRRFGILPDDRRRHVALLGKTGMGKTTLMHRLISSDIVAGRGVALIDPHGDLVESILQGIPRHRTNDVILFDAGDAAHPPSFNVLDCPCPADRPLVASGVVSAFKKLYGHSWGPRLEHILRNLVLALVEVPGTSFLSGLRLLGDARYREDIVKRLNDPIVRAFWEREFASMPAKLQAEAIAPIQNKLGHFVSSPLLRNIVCQPTNRLRMREIMDEGKILLANLAKGRVGDDASALLGSFLVTDIQRAAMSRAAMLEADRRDFFLYVDEFQNFATESFASILSEARKYRLSITVANQYLAQLDEQTLHALFGNVGTLVAFAVGAHDAELLVEQLGGDLTAQDLLRQPRFRAYARLLVDGTPSRPFSMETIVPPRPPRSAARPDVLRRTSRHRYAREVNEVSRHIAEALRAA